MAGNYLHADGSSIYDFRILLATFTKVFKEGKKGGKGWVSYMSHSVS